MGIQCLLSRGVILLARYSPKKAVSAAGAAAYVGGHLQDSKEVGDLATLKGYLSRDGMVRPVVANPELWARVGWDSEALELPPAPLLEALTRGEDLTGTRLTRRGSGPKNQVPFRAPEELLVTLPCEVSEALARLGAEASHRVMEAVLQEALRQIETQAVRVRKGQGERGWAPAQTLSLAYIHEENRGGETHLHGHLYTFGPALDQEGKWRTPGQPGAPLLAAGQGRPGQPPREAPSQPGSEWPASAHGGHGRGLSEGGAGGGDLSPIRLPDRAPSPSWRDPHPALRRGSPGRLRHADSARRAPGRARNPVDRRGSSAHTQGARTGAKVLRKIPKTDPSQACGSVQKQAQRAGPALTLISHPQGTRPDPPVVRN